MNGMSSAGRPDSPRFDPSGLLTFFGDDRGFLEEFVTLFVEDSTRLGNDLRSALETGDGDQLRQIAHALKGMLAYLGRCAALDLAHELESLGPAADLARAPGVVARLVAELELVRRQLGTL